MRASNNNRIPPLTITFLCFTSLIVIFSSFNSVAADEGAILFANHPVACEYTNTTVISGVVTIPGTARKVGSQSSKALVQPAPPGIIKTTIFINAIRINTHVPATMNKMFSTPNSKGRMEDCFFLQSLPMNKNAII